ncbi:MAG: hypothetical protein ABIH37_05310 [archaeon]
MSKLQEIQDRYVIGGYSGKALEKKLNKNATYQKLFKSYRNKTKKLQSGISKKELKKYPLPLPEDFKIIKMIKKLKNKNLSKHDKEIVSIISSQLELDWRTPLIKYLNKLLKKYSR